MDRVTIPTDPEITAVRWALAEPCGECQGCLMAAHIKYMTALVDDTLARAVQDLDAKMPPRMYFSRVDDIVRRRDLAVQKLQPINPKFLECDRNLLTVEWAP